VHTQNGCQVSLSHQLFQAGYISLSYIIAFHYAVIVNIILAPDGTVTFTRNVMTKDPYWFRINTQLGHLEVSPTGTIEDDGDDMLQMDFANKVIGGGVLGSVRDKNIFLFLCFCVEDNATQQGAVQEEIRFMINPELIVSRLFTEELEKNEAVVIVGAERFTESILYFFHQLCVRVV